MVDISKSLGGLIKNIRLLIVNPTQLIRQQKPKASIKKGVVVLLIVALISIAFTAVSMFSFSKDATGFPKILLVMGFLLTAAISPIFLIIYSFVLGAVEFALMRVFKGKGSFEELYYLIAVIYFPVSTVVSAVVSYGAYSILFADLGPIDLASGSIYLPSIIVWILEHIYPFFLLTLILREVGQFSTKRAVACWLIPTSLVFIPYLVMILLFSMSGPSDLSTLTIEGFEVIRPQFNSMISSGSSDRATLLLAFLNYGKEVSLDTSTLTVSNYGRICDVKNVSISGFVDQDLSKDPVLKLGGRSILFMTIHVSGESCGGLKGNAFNYFISMKATKDGEVLDNIGTISGEYEYASSEYRKKQNTTSKT